MQSKIIKFTTKRPRLKLNYNDDQAMFHEAAAQTFPKTSANEVRTEEPSILKGIVNKRRHAIRENFMKLY